MPLSSRPAFTRHALFADTNWTGLPAGFPFESVVSLAPVIAHWQAMSAADPGTYGAAWQRLERALAGIPELSAPIHDVRLLEQHDELIRELVRPLFPSSEWTSDARALSGPFGGHLLYRTRPYEKAMGAYLEARMDIINVHDHYLRTLYAYKAILGRFYGITLDLDQPLVFVIPQGDTGLSRYYKLNASTKFATIELCGDLPPLSMADVDALLQNVGDLARWQALLPPRLFRFVGLTVAMLTDVTHETATAAITHLVLTNSAAGANAEALEQEVQTLFRDASLRLGVAAVGADGSLDDRSEHPLWNPLVIRDAAPARHPRLEGSVYEHALRNGEGSVVRDVKELGEADASLRTFLMEQGVGSVLLQPLRHDGRVLGLMELSFPEPRAVDAATILKARRIEPVFALALYVADSTARLHRSLTHLQATQAQLVQQEKMASLGALTAGIAHEIKNPLNFVTNFSSLCVELIDELRAAMEAGDAGEAAALLTDLQLSTSKIHEHGQRADAIVRSMMQHARGGSARRERVNLNDLVAEYVALAYHGKKAQCPGFDVALTQELGEDVVDVEIVPQELGRVVLNLVSNAFDALWAGDAQGDDPGQPAVSVSTRRSGERVVICVRDNGPGIPADVRDKIFEPFFTTKPPGQGTGLGLSLSYDIVTQGHGGTLVVESEEGEGTTFTVTLPVRPNPVEG